MMPPGEWEKTVNQIKIRTQCRNKVHCATAPPDFAMAPTLIHDTGLIAPMVRRKLLDVYCGRGLETSS